MASIVHGGRFDFDDGGTYCGGWEDGKAHGYGVCTGPKALGEFSGFWQFGYEVSGVYLWPSGNCYEGQWMSGKRHGLGVEKKGRWIYKGEWTQGFKGRYGLRISERSGARFEGTWANGLQDGYGVEIYGDGGSYHGQISQGLRSGYGIRRSVPYAVATRFKLKGISDSLSSLRSDNEDEKLQREREKRSDDNRGGFVLRGRFDFGDEIKKHPNFQSIEQKPSLKKTILSKLRKQKSTGDIIDCKKLNSFRSTTSSTSYDSKHSNRTVPAYETHDNHSLIDADDVNGILDPSVVETYMGEWKADKRTGYGVAERSDGLKYEGEWLNNKKNGYGITTFRDGSKEEGKYKSNVLAKNRKRFGKLLSLRSSKLRERVEFAANSAMNAAQSAQQKAEIALSRANNARAKAQAAEISAKQSRSDSEMARQKAREIAPDFIQPGLTQSRVIIPLDIDRQGDGGRVVQNQVPTTPPYPTNFGAAFDSNQKAYLDPAIQFNANVLGPQYFVTKPSQMPGYYVGAPGPLMSQSSHIETVPFQLSLNSDATNIPRSLPQGSGTQMLQRQMTSSSYQANNPYPIGISQSNFQPSLEQYQMSYPSPISYIDQTSSSLQSVEGRSNDFIGDQRVNSNQLLTDEPTTQNQHFHTDCSPHPLLDQQNLNNETLARRRTLLRSHEISKHTVEEDNLISKGSSDEHDSTLKQETSSIPQPSPEINRRKSLPCFVTEPVYKEHNDDMHEMLVIDEGVRKRIKECTTTTTTSDKSPIFSDESPTLPHKIILQNIRGTPSISIPDDIEQVHIKGLTREEINHLSSKRREELRYEKKLQEEPLLRLRIQAKDCVMRHKILIAIILLNFSLAVWFLKMLN